MDEDKKNMIGVVILASVVVALLLCFWAWGESPAQQVSSKELCSGEKIKFLETKSDSIEHSRAELILEICYSEEMLKAYQYLENDDIDKARVSLRSAVADAKEVLNTVGETPQSGSDKTTINKINETTTSLRGKKNGLRIVRNKYRERPSGDLDSPYIGLYIPLPNGFIFM